jgi:hypothetical protein
MSSLIRPLLPRPARRSHHSAASAAGPSSSGSSSPSISSRLRPHAGRRTGQPSIRRRRESVLRASPKAQARRRARHSQGAAFPWVPDWWTAEGREVDRARRALRLRRTKVSEREDPFAAVIRCTADPSKADKRTRSKWSRVMRYAAAYKPDSEAVDQFVQGKGGINECAARFSRCLGRGALRRTAD